MTAMSRHQSIDNLAALWAEGNAQVLPVVGEPWCEIRLDPARATASLVTLFRPPEPEVSKMRHLTATTYVRDSTDVIELAVSVDNNLQAVYGLLTSIADGIQLDGRGLSQSVADSVRRHKEVLSPVYGLSETAEIGLVGELLYLNSLIQTLGPGPAIAAWRGPDAAEHDFVFDDLAVEVKTTSHEARKHRIATIWQLDAVPNVPLYLLSVQVTGGTSGAGFTLSDLVQAVRSDASGYVVPFDEKMALQGWTEDQADMYRTLWRLRSSPHAYRVTPDFPSLTPSALQPHVDLKLISEVSYVVDVSHLPPSQLPKPYDAFTTEQDRILD